MPPRPPRRSVESGCHGVATPSRPPRPQCHDVHNAPAPHDDWKDHA